MKTPALLCSKFIQDTILSESAKVIENMTKRLWCAFFLGHGVVKTSNSPHFLHIITDCTTVITTCTLYVQCFSALIVSSNVWWQSWKLKTSTYEHVLYSVDLHIRHMSRSVLLHVRIVIRCPQYCRHRQEVSRTLCQETVSVCVFRACS